MLNPRCGVLLPIVTALAIYPAAAQGHRAVVDHWAGQCAARPVLQLRWLMPQELLDGRDSHKVLDRFETTETASYHYPDSMLVQTRVLPNNDLQDGLRARRLDKDVEITADGHQVERAVGLGVERDLGEGHSVRRYVGAEALRAPPLLGMWIHENPEKCHELHSDVPGESVFAVPEFNLRFTLRAEDAGPWMSRIEIVRPDGDLRAWWVYDDPVPVEGAGYQMGAVRTRYSVLRDGSIYKGFPDQLEYCRASFQEPAGPEAVGAARDQPAPGLASPPRADVVRVKAGASRWLMAGAIALLAVIGLVAWGRARAS